MEMNILLARTTVNRYICSKCWGNLIIKHVKEDRNLADVSCINCGNDTFITRSSIKRMKDQSWEDLSNARWNLMGFIDNPNDNKTADEIIKTMGF